LAEWFYEAGIGEARAALVEAGAILEAIIEPDAPGVRAGAIVPARLDEVLVPRLSGKITLDGGEPAMLDGIPNGVTQGAGLVVRIVREAIPEAGRPKAAKAVPVLTDEATHPGPNLAERITASGIPVRHLMAHQPDALEDAGWSELLEEAATGEIAFMGGALRMSVTPAMTLFDVDGAPPAEPLAIAGAAAAGRAIRRFGIGGSIGIDLPTLPGKSARQAAAAALDSTLPLPFERTAVNGFGFIQVIRKRTRASLPELIAADRTVFALRAALRRAERDGALHLPAAQYSRLTEHPEWIEALERRAGRTIIPVLQ
jgi:ribonuclease G